MNAYCVTFDNLGEVTALQRGEFPAGEPLGRHFSVTRALPRVLAALEEAGVRATFFVEGLNTELYPETLQAIAAAGHEVAYHGWRHEDWASLERDEEAQLLERGVRALDALGLRPAGFRPPGGELTPSSLELLAELGFEYCSPAGEEVEVRGGLAIIPFAWEMVDAWHVLPRFAEARGDAAPFEEQLRGAPDRRACVIFHPFLLDDEERLAVLRGHLEALGGRAAPCREVAARLRTARAS